MCGSVSRTQGKSLILARCCTAESGTGFVLGYAAAVPKGWVCAGYDEKCTQRTLEKPVARVDGRAAKHEPVRARNSCLLPSITKQPR